MRATPTREDETCPKCGAWLPTSAATHVCVMPMHSNATPIRPYDVSPSVVAAPLSFRDQCAIAVIQGLTMHFGTATSGGVGQRAIVAFDLADAMDAERQKRETR